MVRPATQPVPEEDPGAPTPAQDEARFEELMLEIKQISARRSSAGIWLPLKAAAVFASGYHPERTRLWAENGLVHLRRDEVLLRPRLTASITARPQVLVAHVLSGHDAALAEMKMAKLTFVRDRIFSLRSTTSDLGELVFKAANHIDPNTVFIAGHRIKDGLAARFYDFGTTSRARLTSMSTWVLGSGMNA